MKAIFSKRHIRLALLVSGIAGLIGAVVLVRHTRHRHDQRMASSCANHSIQLKFLVMEFVEQQDRFPTEGDTRSALAEMSAEGQWPAGWLCSYGSSCPESYLRDESIGYVFVADGLPTKVVAEDSALVFFCPSGSHQSSEQHCHAVVGRGELVCLKSNAEMIGLLHREIARAKDSSVPYSTNAILKMERELKAREERARMQEPNKSTGTNRRPAAPIEAGPPSGRCFCARALSPAAVASPHRYA